MPLLGDDPSIDIPIWYPDGDTDLNPLRAAFIMQANSTLTQLQRVLARQRSQVLYTDKFIASANWLVVTQKLRIIGETWAYFELTVQRTTKKLAVPSTGNFKPNLLGSINDVSMVPQSLAGLSSSKSGRLCVAHAISSGEVKLDAINSGADIKVDDQLTLAGAWPLDNWVDSEV